MFSTMNPPPVDEIAKHLALTVGKDGAPLLTREQVEERARAIYQEVGITGFPLRLRPWPSKTTRGIFPYPSYLIDDTRYDLNKIGPGDKGGFGINGPGISCGDLIKLGRACLLRQKFFPNGWPKGLRDLFVDQESHLDAVEELCWLDRWRGVSRVRTGVKMIAGSDKDVDLVFDSYTVPVFAEIKNRRRESVGVVDGWHRSRNYSSVFDDLIGKFSPARNDGALHVACISTHLEPDDALDAQAKSFLDEHGEIDAIIVWSDHSRDGRQNIAIYSEPHIRAQIEALLASAEREDEQKWYTVQHLERNSEEGRVLSGPELIEWLRRQT